HADSEVSETEEHLWLEPVQPDRTVTPTTVCPPRSLEVDQRSFSVAARDRRLPDGPATVIRTASCKTTALSYASHSSGQNLLHSRPQPARLTLAKYRRQPRPQNHRDEGLCPIVPTSFHPGSR